MAIPLVGTAGVYTRWGRLGGLLNACNSWRGTANLSGASIVSLGTGIDNINAQYLASSQDLVSQLYPTREQVRNALNGLPAYLQSLANATILRMVDDDGAIYDGSVKEAMKILRAQMITSGDSIAANTVSATVAAGGSNTGNAVVLASLVGPDGLIFQTPFPEIVLLSVTTDAQSGTATAGSEQLLAQGEVPQASPLFWDYPKGSGGIAQLTAIDPDTNANSVGNLLTNGDFEGWTATNIPNNWPKDTGNYGVTIGRSTSSYTGTYALEFIGTGAELTSVSQEFGASAGTLAPLMPSTVYGVNCWIKVSAVPAAGVLAISITDGSGTVVNDDAGTANTISKSLPAATTGYLPLSGFFRTPSVLPSTTKARIKLTTALDNTKGVFIDDLSIAPATQVYPGGPYLANFRGSIDQVIGDLWRITVANNYTAINWARLLDVFFGMRVMGVQMPYSGSPTIGSALIV